ncbi:poly(A) polymerase alpha isoform X2 [Eurytemora carolleeae]|uniref:poly(A) polymerase alpha isoform X2 n=1 Tax=Eurytemora carolleeae TaxID=1294199 RepID=UPI000C7700C9|nr:poly(A) polymerase alpha isoform X2 [Eurytemora carolleeae]|eukprot:XP_023331331.1 poly(A) polymerase alpha-like isoform X2 [Eurytemora affinis]
MPTLRSQYQHVRQDLQAELELTNLTANPAINPNQQTMSCDYASPCSPSKSLTGPSITMVCSVERVKSVPISPSQNIINVSASSSDDDRSLTSNNSVSKQEIVRGNGRKNPSSNRKNSKNSNGYRKSRRSSGSIGEDLLNTATVHAPLPAQQNIPVYSNPSHPTHLTTSGSMHLSSFQAYKLTAEQAIMQSLHVPRIPGLDGLSGFPNMGNLPYMEQFSMMMDGRGGEGRSDLPIRNENYGLDYQAYIGEQPSVEIEFPNTDAGLRSVLEQHGCFETPEGLTAREEIVKSLDLLVKQWVRSCGLEKGLDYMVVEKNQGMVLIYGSCKLGAADRDADMDLICVAPSYVSREQFFTTMYQKLLKHKDVHELRRLPDVFVPVMKFQFNQTEIDFTFASLTEPVPEKESALLNEVFTENLDDRCLRSLNGYRATCELLTLVPDVRVFQLSLRAIKLWGKMNGIYGNILGYLGGASWAILVARTCQEQAKRQNAEHCPKEVVFTFFQMFSQWKWPAPVYIRQVMDQPSSAWNPSVNAGDRDHVMPIITSSVPQMNSAVNINKSIQKYIQEKMSEAHQICHQIQAGLVGWDSLFKPFPFYQEYDEFLNITGECETDSLFWHGCIESKLRYLKEKIESSQRVFSVRIWPKGFSKKEGRVFVQNWFIGVAKSGNNLEKLVAEDCRVFVERCFGDLRKTFGNSPMVKQAFSVRYSVVSRSKIFSLLPLKDLHMNTNEKPPATYASIAQGNMSRVPTPPVQVLSTSNHQSIIHPSYIPQPASSQAFSSNFAYHTQTSSTYTTATASMGTNLNNAYPNQPIIFPMYMGALFGHHHDRMSPPAILIPNPRSMSPRSTLSPRGYSSRNNSPNYQRTQTNSPSQFIYNEGLVPGISVSGPGIPQTRGISVPTAYLGSPGAFPSYSPRQYHLSHLGPFNFPPPPAGQAAGITPTPLNVPRNSPNQSARPSPRPLEPQRSGVVAVVNGVRSINNNVKMPYSCVSLPELEQAERKKITRAQKDSSEEDRLRSVSNSSDTVAPNFLYRSRINHQDAPPPSPFQTLYNSQPQPFFNLHHSPSTQSLPGMIPLSQADVTIPPPQPHSAPDSPVNQDNQQFTFSRGVKPLLARPHRSPRGSVSDDDRG